MNSFISYSSKDGAIADMICGHLEARGVSCWIAPRDITAGTVYADAIIDGISRAESLVLILSDNSNLSRHVQAEVERAFSLSKPVFPVRIRDVRPSRGLELFVSGSQWIDALSLPLDSKMNELASAILGLGKNIIQTVERENEDFNIPEKRGAISKLLQKVDIVAVACKLSETGFTGLDFAPIEQFDNWMTADPSEAEQARTIQAALKRHTQDHMNRRVLNLAVFGPVGSGRVFPVQQTARNASLKSTIDIEIQLAALQDPKDLIQYYRKAQDAALYGKTAMLWFEGFDITLSGIPFGWIQHFVVTMRKSEFIDDRVSRPLGPCVLCFVATEHFSHAHLTKALLAQGQSTILSNFSSMINCYLDVRGINPVWPEDCVYLLNRALLLRTILQSKHLSITPTLRRALITVPEFYYNARSLQAVLDACHPQGKGNLLTEDSLPTDSELNQHIDTRWLRKALKEYAV